MDDIFLIGNDKDNFSIKDLGEVEYIFGIRTCRDESKRMIGLG